jgi:hypothetical protein
MYGSNASPRAMRSSSFRPDSVIALSHAARLALMRAISARFFSRCSEVISLPPGARWYAS